MREHVCLAVIYRRRLLLIKRKKMLVLPRKKLGPEELEIDCIFYRIIKEVPGLKINDLMPIGKFNGKNLLQWNPIRDKIYIAKAESNFFNNSFQTGNSIKWIKNLGGDKISKKTKRIFWVLKGEGCL